MNKLFCMSLLFCAFVSKAQQKTVAEIDLESCITKALSENIDLKTATNNTLYYSYEYKKAMANVLPQLSANWNMNKIYGTVFDPVSFQRIQKATTTSFPSINASITVFDGLSGLAQQQQANALKQTAVYNKQNQEQQLVLSVCETYFTCMRQNKTLGVYRSRIKAMETLLKTTRIQVEKGDRQLAELYSVESQLESEKAAYLEINTTYNNALNDLFTLMRSAVPDSVVLKEKEFSPVIPDSDQNLYEKVLKNNVSILAKEGEYISEKFQRKKIYSNFMPTVSLTGTLASSYSSNGIFDYTLGTILYPSYSDQLHLNFYQIAGITVQIPLFSKMSNYYNVRQQSITLENKKLELEKQKLTVQNQLSTYLNNKKTISQKQVALEKSLASANEAWKAGEMQFSKGGITFYEMLNALNKKNQAEIDAWQNQADAWLLDQKINALVGKQ